MKEKKVLSLFGALMLLSATVFCQNTDTLAQRPGFDTAVATVIPPRPACLPDANRYGVAFQSLTHNEWVFNANAGECYAILLDTMGDGIKTTPEAAIASVKFALENNDPKMVVGYNSAISGKKMISFAEKSRSYWAHPWKRINPFWMLYLRNGCANPVCVYEPIQKKSEQTPRGGYETPQLCKEVNINLAVTVNNFAPCPPPIATPTTQCCQVPKLTWEYIYPMFGSRSTYSNDLQHENWFLGFGYRRHWRDSSQLFSNYAGSELSFSLRNGGDVVCDTCLNFTEDELQKPIVRWEIFFGREWGIRENSTLRSFTEIRYTLVQPMGLVHDRVFLPKKSGLSLSGGLRFDVLKNLEFEGEAELDLITREFGGGLKLCLHLN